MKLPWRPREYAAVLDALHQTEQLLMMSELRRAGAVVETRKMQSDVRTELRERRKGRRAP